MPQALILAISVEKSVPLGYILRIPQITGLLSVQKELSGFVGVLVSLDVKALSKKVHRLPTLQRPVLLL